MLVYLDHVSDASGCVEPNCKHQLGPFAVPTLGEKVLRTGAQRFWRLIIRKCGPKLPMPWRAIPLSTTRGNNRPPWCPKSSNNIQICRYSILTNPEFRIRVRHLLHQYTANETCSSACPKVPQRTVTMRIRNVLLHQHLSNSPRLFPRRQTIHSTIPIVNVAVK